MVRIFPDLTTGELRAEKTVFGHLFSQQLLRQFQSVYIQQNNLHFLLIFLHVGLILALLYEISMSSRALFFDKPEVKRGVKT